MSNLPDRPLSTEESHSLRDAIHFLGRGIKQALRKRNTFGDRIIITDEVLVYEGSKLRFKSKAHIVNQGLIWMINLISTVGFAAGYVQFSSLGWTAKTNSYMRVGTGAGVTTGATTALSTPSAVAPDSQSGATSSPTAGQYRVSWTATWNAGSLTAIVVTELGLDLAFADYVALQAFGWTRGTNVSEAAAFFSRLSEADGDFVHFTVNIAVPLTIQWNLTFTFA